MQISTCLVGDQAKTHVKFPFLLSLPPTDLEWPCLSSVFPCSLCMEASFRSQLGNTEYCEPTMRIFFFSMCNKLMVKIMLKNKEFASMPSNLVSQRYWILLLWCGGKQFKENECLFHKVRLLAKWLQHRKVNKSIKSHLFFNWKCNNFFGLYLWFYRFIKDVRTWKCWLYLGSCYEMHHVWNSDMLMVIYTHHVFLGGNNSNLSGWIC